MDRGVLIQGKGVILGDHEIWELYLPPNTMLMSNRNFPTLPKEFWILCQLPLTLDSNWT